MAVSTGIEVSQEAQVLVGITPMTAWSDNTAEAKVANNVYAPTVGACLSAHPWRWAAHQEVLNRLTAEPHAPWSAAYQLPANLGTIRSIRVDGTPIRFDRFGDKIYCDAERNDQVVLDFIREAPDETIWPDYFRWYVVTRLAMIFASAVTRKASLAEVWRMENLEALEVAKRRDSQGRTASKVSTKRFIQTRR